MDPAEVDQKDALTCYCRLFCTPGRFRTSTVSMGRSVSRRFVAATLMAGLCLGATPSGDSPKEEAMALAKKARRAEKAGHNADAYLLYAEASALQRQNKGYRAKMAS